MTKARDIEAIVADADITVEIIRVNCGESLANEVAALISDWRAKDKQIDLFSQAILDHYREKRAAVEAMRAKCELIVREKIHYVPGICVSSAIEIANAIAALKP